MNPKVSKKNTSATYGFTLIEMIVSVGIFSILMIVLTALFSQFVFTQRRDIAEQKLLEELRFALEVFNREARTAYGSTYMLPDGTGRSVMFRNQNGLCVHYQLEEGRLERAEKAVGDGACTIGDFAGTQYVFLTSSDVVITELRFDVTTSTVENGVLDRQGFITAIMQARSANLSVAPIDLQSTVASRQTRAF